MEALSWIIPVGALVIYVVVKWLGRRGYCVWCGFVGTVTIDRTPLDNMGWRIGKTTRIVIANCDHGWKKV